MPDILAIAEASMRNGMLQLDAVSRNVANLNTQGYKREIYLSHAFDDHLITAAGSMSGAQPPDQPSTDARDFSAGSMKYTGSALNMAIEGKGFFQLQTAQGIVLTRDGQFQLNRSGQLVSADGATVVTKGSLTLDNSDFKVLSDGTVVVAGMQQTQLDLVDADPGTLKTVAPGRYQSASATSMDPGLAHVRQGYLENSNVNSLNEMVDMMGVVRHVEASQQLIRAYDEIIDNAVSTLGQF